MKAKVETISTFALLLALTVFPIVLAQDTVGVKAGDWVLYSVKRLGVSNSAWVYSDAVWIKVEVLNVSGTVVTLRETIHYDDGDEDVSIGLWDVQCDTRRASYFIATDLMPGDKVGEYPILDYQKNKWVNVDLKLNDTEFRTYGGVTREVNPMKFSFVTPYILYDEHTTWERHWDKHTGFLLEEKITVYLLGSERHNETNPESTYNVEIADTNMWEMETEQSFPWQMLALAVPVGVIIAVATVKLRNKNKKEVEEK